MLLIPYLLCAGFPGDLAEMPRVCISTQPQWDADADAAVLSTRSLGSIHMTSQAQQLTASSQGLKWNSTLTAC